MITLSLSAVHLFAANLFTSKDEARFYLKGVCIETNAEKGIIRYTATDGHRMLSAWQTQDEVPAVPAFIIPSETIKKLEKTYNKPGKRNSVPDVLTVTRNDDGALTFCHNGVTFSDREIDGTFPDWRRVIPGQYLSQDFGEERGTPELSFNADYLSSFAKAFQMLGQDMPGLHIQAIDGNHPLHIVPDKDALPAFGILMPLRRGISVPAVIVE